MMTRPLRSASILVVLLLACQTASGQPQTSFGGAYGGLGDRRQQLIDNWVGRMVKTAGQPIAPADFYDTFLSQSAKTTFDAVTHALMTTTLTDIAGTALGDTLALVEEVDAVRGELTDARGDRQFRMYVRLTGSALDTLQRSAQFKRGPDNSVYHKGFPINYRAQGETPSIQISISLDHRRADIDVDYRSSSFPAALFNGHLTSSNSDVRAGNNYDRHLNRWSGFQNWWQGFFGVRHAPAPEAAGSGKIELLRTPRAGKAAIEVMVKDFLDAWLVEGNIIAAMGYVSDRSFACLARDSDDPSAFDRGVAPLQLMNNLKAAHDALGPRESLNGLVVGTRLVSQGLKVVNQPHHAQFVIHAVPDDLAASMECESQLTLGDAKAPRRRYGNYYGATFYVGGSRDTPVALLWGQDQEHWKIVSWSVGTETAATPTPEPVDDSNVVRLAADPGLATAARGFLESWLIRHDANAAFAYISPKAYDCYNLERDRAAPAAASAEDAGRLLRASLESSAKKIGNASSLDSILTAAEPVHPATRILQHRDSRTFTLSSIPNAVADTAECQARATGANVADAMPLEYGKGFGMTVRFQTRGGEAPALRLLWRREGDRWLITSYAVEMP